MNILKKCDYNNVMDVRAKDFPDQFNNGENTSLPNENMPNDKNGVGNNVMDVRAKDFPEQFNNGENTSLPNENMPNDKNGVGNPSPLPYGEQCQSLPRGTLTGSLSAIIQNYCNVTTRKINRIRQTPGAKLWQRNFWEHIIRDENELNRIRQYIKNNPLKWTDDDYFEAV
ncbi:transposase [Caldithrix abyssi]